MQNPTCPQCHSPIPADAPGGLCPGCLLLGVAGPTNPSQTFTASTPTIEEVAAAFPELEVLELIGQGGMGVVFRARQPRLDRVVALKILPPALAAQPGFAERFTREARVLARLAHPHIVAIYDFGESAGFFYLTMEYMNGVNLRAAMRAGVKPEQALLLVPRICEALQFAHDHGVLHRDIKPENILLDTHGTPKLADFGIAKLAGEDTARTGLTATGATLGTAAYMAPEQVEKPATVDHRADIYSLGVVFYEMLTGELPLGRFSAPSEKSSVNRGVDEVVMRALEKERERRQQSATEMRTQVEDLGSGKVPPTPLSAVAAPNPTSVRRGRMFALAGLGLYLTSAVASIAAVAWVSHARSASGAGGFHRSELEMFQEHPLAYTVLGLLLASAGVGGLIALFTALLWYRYRSPWFFGGVLVASLSVMLILGSAGLHLPGILLGLAAIGYCVHRFREFFPIDERLQPSAPGTGNPWPRRIFILIFVLIAVPAMLIAIGLVVPMLARQSHQEPAFRERAVNSARTVEIQNDAIRLARERLAETSKRVAAGVVSPSEKAAAERDLAVAEARDDETKIAEAELTYAERRFADLQSLERVGVVTPAEAREAEQARNAARLRLEKARASTGLERDAVRKLPAIEKPVQR